VINFNFRMSIMLNKLLEQCLLKRIKEILLTKMLVISHQSKIAVLEQDTTTISKVTSLLQDSKTCQFQDRHREKLTQSNKRSRLKRLRNR